MNNQRQSTTRIPAVQTTKGRRTRRIAAITVLSAAVVLLAGLITWLILLAVSPGGSTGGAENTIGSDTPKAQSINHATITALGSGANFSVTYPDTWAVATVDSTRLTLTSKSSDSSNQTVLELSSTMPQSAGCAMLTPGFIIKYYDTAPIVGWAGNSFVGFYETDGNTWCYLSGIAATTDLATDATGQSADKLYLQASSSRPSINTSASGGDQIYVSSYKSFTSEAQARQYVESREYSEQKDILRSLMVKR